VKRSGYARISKIENYSRISNRTWAASETLDAILDAVERKNTITSAQINNLMTNRKAKFRNRRQLEVSDTHLLTRAVDETNRLIARAELNHHEQRCTRKEWCILIAVGYGSTYDEIGAVHGVPGNTAKTWAHRAKLKLAA
jgi:DNA-directed RNA polymerase specialized sigma24 family protein